MFIRLLLAVFLLACAGAGAEARWYKGATHVHSLWSDGDAAPEYIIQWYRDNGWDFVCPSEHNLMMTGERWLNIEEGGRLTPERVEALKAQFGARHVEVRSQADGPDQMRLKTLDELKARYDLPGKFVLVPAEEMTTRGGNPHVNALNLREPVAGLPVEGDKAEKMQHYIDQIKAQREKYGVPMIAHINHVNFADRITTEEMLRVNGLAFFEVYNGHDSVHSWGIPAEGVPSHDRHWDVILSMKQRREPDYLLYGVASDDSHRYFNFQVGESNPGRGWVMVRSESLDPDALVGAMERGDFYASTGVTLKDVKSDGKSLSISIEPEKNATYRTQYIGTRRGFDESSRPAVDAAGVPLPRSSLIYSDSIGVVLHETTDLDSTYTFQGDEMYVRARVISDRLQPNPHNHGDFKMAWVQPVLAR